MSSAPSPTRNYADYLICAAQNAAMPVGQWTFKSDPRYQRILEHVMPHQAEAMATQARTEFVDQWDSIAEIAVGAALANDSVGKPLRYPCPELGITCSPSNLRYLWHALLIWRRIQELGYAVNLIELGGGYGGLSLYIDRLARLFATDDCYVMNHVIIDAPDASALTRAYVGYFKLNRVRAYNGLDAGDLAEAVNQIGCKFLFSAYGFAEFDQPTQEWYADRLVRYCQHGLMVWNYATNWPHRPPNPVYAFINTPLLREPERPPMELQNEFVWW